MLLFLLILILLPLLSSIQNEVINSINISKYNWFDNTDKLIFLEGNGKISISSYDDAFLSDKVYLKEDNGYILDDIIYLDDVNDKIYLINTRNQYLKIRYYDLKEQIMEVVHYCTINSCNEEVYMNCTHYTCSLFMDKIRNILYLSTESEYFYLNLNTLESNQCSWDKYQYAHSFVVFDNYIYFIESNIGILRKPLSTVGGISRLVNIVIDKQLINNTNITSFVVDTTRQIMYFTSNHRVFYTSTINNASSSDIIDLNIDINVSIIYQMQINEAGTMLFIAYSQRQKVFITNVATIFGCIECVPNSTFLYSVNEQTSPRTRISLFYYASRLLKKDFHSPSRKLLAEFSSFVTSNVTLPRASSQMVVGYWNHSVFLLGGASTAFQMVKYDMINNSMTDYGANYLPGAPSGSGQYYTQKGEFLFIIDSGGSRISRYNMKTDHYEYSWNNIELPINVAASACLAISEDYLFVLGGDTGNSFRSAIATVQALNLSSYEWLNMNSMTYERQALSCNVHPVTNYLYAIGGSHQDPNPIYVEKIEKIYIGGNIQDENWIILDQPMLPTFRMRSIVFGNDILIIGGFTSMSGSIGSPQARMQIQALNCITDDIIYESALDYAAACTSALIINHTISVFGGETGGDGGQLKYAVGTQFNTWQYALLRPTNKPTKSPTMPPTVTTLLPTQTPSIPPT
eukprot:176227_1